MKGSKSAPTVARRPSRDRPTPAPEGDRPLILFLCEPGLARALTKELKYRGIIRQKARCDEFKLRNYDLLVYPRSQVIGDVLQSRLALHALRAPVFGRHAVTERQLDRLAREFRHEGVDGLVSSVAGAAFQRQDLLRWITKRLRDRHIDVAEQAAHPAWLLVVDHSYWVGFPLFNYHQATARDSAPERMGALPPTIAAAMVFLAVPQPGEVIWDPVAGSGSLLLEASVMAPNSRLIGTDLDHEAIAIAASRLRGKRVTLAVRDSAGEQFPVPNVSLTLANLPWGRQHTSELPLKQLYQGILEASLRNSTPGWRGCFITGDPPAFLAAVDRLGQLEVEIRTSVKVRGRAAEIFLVRRSTAVSAASPPFPSSQRCAGRN